MKITNLDDSHILDHMSGKELAQLRTVSKNFRSFVNKRLDLKHKMDQKRDYYNRLERTLNNISRKDSVPRSAMSRRNISLGKLVRHKMGGIHQRDENNYMIKVPGSEKYKITPYMRNIDNAVSVIDILRRKPKTNVERDDEDDTLYFDVDGKGYSLNRSGYLTIPRSSGIRGVRVGDIFSKSDKRKLLH
jgi:F-box domain